MDATMIKRHTKSCLKYHFNLAPICSLQTLKYNTTHRNKKQKQTNQISHNLEREASSVPPNEQLTSEELSYKRQLVSHI